MQLNINHQYVRSAIIRLKEHNPSYEPAEINKLFESKYHCKIHVDQTDPWAINGSINFDEEKYYNWFTMQFQGELVE